MNRGLAKALDDSLSLKTISSISIEREPMKDATVLHAIFLVSQPRKRMCTGCGVNRLFAGVSGAHAAALFRDIKEFSIVAWDDDQHDNSNLKGGHGRGGAVHAVAPTGPEPTIASLASEGKLRLDRCTGQKAIKPRGVPPVHGELR